jgi:hypothetical protein
LASLRFTPFDYQVQAARVALRRMRGRAILADEVGLGKTIEAGLISLVSPGLLGTAAQFRAASAASDPKKALEPRNVAALRKRTAEVMIRPYRLHVIEIGALRRQPRSVARPGAPTTRRSAVSARRRYLLATGPG